MGLRAQAMLFVDDWPPHVQTAIAAGFQGVVLDRDAEAPAVAGWGQPTGASSRDGTRVGERPARLASSANQMASRTAQPAGSLLK
jgi:FMN phosphatase YigB (HAD superfamily)